MTKERKVFRRQVKTVTTAPKLVRRFLQVSDQVTSTRSTRRKKMTMRNRKGRQKVKGKQRAWPMWKTETEMETLH